MTKSRSLIKEFIIGFGFINGVWVAIGTSPQDLIFDFLKPYIGNLPTILQTIFVIIPIILMILTIWMILKILKKGRLLGAIAVLMAFISGTIIFRDWQSSIVLLVIALILGLIAFRNRK